MATAILMPRLSDSMEEGVILTWMKSIGDEVAIGDELVEIETDKANMVFEADATGVLIEIVAAEGDTRPIGEVIAWVGGAGEASGNGAKRTHARPADQAPPGAASGSAGPASGATLGGRAKAKASPVARRIAQDHAVDLTSIAGSGPGGRIVKADIERELASGSASTKDHPLSPLSGDSSTSSPAQAGRASPPDTEETPSAQNSHAAPAGALGLRDAPEKDGTPTAKGTVSVVELTKLQQTVSRRMAESKATAPHFYLQAEIDMTRAQEARKRIKSTAEGKRPSFNDMVVKACAIALGELPRANGAYRDGKWELYARINVGIAVAARDALVVPTIFDADKKGLRQIATESRALAARVREQTITPPELSGGTFTVSNLGMYGISAMASVLNMPQAAILGVGAIADQPVARSGEVSIAPVMTVTLGCDHRILYGADGAEFLGRVRALLEEPLGLAL